MGIKRAKKTLGAYQTRGRLDTHVKRAKKRPVAPARKGRKGNLKGGGGARAQLAAQGTGHAGAGAPAGPAGPGVPVPGASPADAAASPGPTGAARTVVMVDMSDPICAVLGAKKHESRLLHSLDTLLVLGAGHEALAKLTRAAPPGPGTGTPQAGSARDPRAGDLDGDASVIRKGIAAAQRAFAVEIAARVLWTAEVARHQLHTADGGAPTMVFGVDGYDGPQRAAAAVRGSKSQAKLAAGLDSLREGHWKEGACTQGSTPMTATFITMLFH